MFRKELVRSLDLNSLSVSIDQSYRRKSCFTNGLVFFIFSHLIFIYNKRAITHILIPLCSERSVLNFFPLNDKETGQVHF